MDDQQFDVWWAFRLAFSDLPDVRIYTRDHRDRDLRPGYSSGRFVTPAAPPITVHLYHESVGDLNTAYHNEAHFPAYLDRDSMVRPIYVTPEQWARSVRLDWSVVDQVLYV